jgi:hypothetical protein
MDREDLKAISQLLKEELEPIKTRLDETYQIVKALEHSAQVNKAEQDKIANDVAHIKGDVESLRKDISNVEIITSSNWADIAKLKAVK